MSKSVILAIVALCFTFGSTTVLAEDAAYQLEEMTVMGAVKSRDTSEASDVETVEEPALEELPVIEE